MRAIDHYSPQLIWRAYKGYEPYIERLLVEEESALGVCVSTDFIRIGHWHDTFLRGFGKRRIQDQSKDKRKSLCQT